MITSDFLESIKEFFKFRTEGVAYTGNFNLLVMDFKIIRKQEDLS